MYKRYSKRTTRLQKLFANNNIRDCTFFYLKFRQNVYLTFGSRVSDPDPYPDWIRIQSGQWIRIRIWSPDPDPGGQKWPTKVEKKLRNFMVGVLDVLFWELNASFVTWTSFVKA